MHYFLAEQKLYLNQSVLK